MTVKTPDQALTELGELYRSRNAVYGDTYKDFGKIMIGFFPNPTTITTEAEWNRLALFFHCADKLGRYARQFFTGGHRDSLDDNSVYSQLLAHVDALAREAILPETAGQILLVSDEFYWVKFKNDPSVSFVMKLESGVFWHRGNMIAPHDVVIISHVPRPKI